MDESSKFYTVRGYQRMEQDSKALTSAMEDYVEMIYRHCLVDGYVRTNTLSELLNIAAPSATRMVQKLKELGLVDNKKYGYITLTESGKDIGKFLLERHNTIEAFLQNLGVDRDLLTETELIEHNVSAATLGRISTFNDFVEQNPDVMEKYKTFYHNNAD